MKPKYFLLAAAAALSLSASAQQMTVNAGRTTFGLRAGVNLQNINGKDAAGNNLENSLNTGFHAGVNAEIPVGTGSYLQPGVLYSTKGAEWSNGIKTTLNYVEIPVNFIYKPILGTGNMVLGFGPYAAFGLGGKAKYPNGNEGDISFDEEFNTAENTYEQFKGFDAGANVLAGYEFANRVSVQLNAQLGLVDINPERSGNDQTRWRNTGFGLSLGYRF